MKKFKEFIKNIIKLLKGTLSINEISQPSALMFMTLTYFIYILIIGIIFKDITDNMVVIFQTLVVAIGGINAADLIKNKDTL